MPAALTRVNSLPRGVRGRPAQSWFNCRDRVLAKDSSLPLALAY